MTMIGVPRAIVGVGDGIRTGFNETVSTIATRRFVKLVAGSAPGSIDLPDASAGAYGVTMHAIASGYRGDVQRTGVAVVELGGTVARGDFVRTDATGKAVAVTTATQVVLGQCISGGASAEFGEIELTLAVALGATGATGGTGPTGATGPTGPTGPT